ncbi:MAG: lipopolysaccharide heptosyltransferase II [Candidatus Omnitrophica bacterium]|nr:lipopolysaccharide heptosyltransferase II [Candidatus Omnitrophota bacterium]
MTIVELLRFMAKNFVESIEYVFWGLFLLLSRKGRKNHPGQDPEKILVVQLASVGDVVMSTPAIKRLKERYAGKRIDVLTAQNTGELLENDPNVDDVIKCSPRFWRSARYMVESVRTIRRLRENNYDICIDLGGVFESVVWSSLAGTRFTLGPLRKIKRGPFSSSTRAFYGLSQKIECEHILKRYLEVLKPLVGEAPFREGSESLSIPDEARQECDRFLHDNALVSGNYAVIHPGAKWPPKRWPESHFARLIDLLSGETPITPVLAGGRKDLPLLNRIRDISENKKLVVADDLSLLALASLIDKAAVFVGNDSGPSHIAAAVGTPLVALFGPTDPAVSAPVSDKMVLLHDKISCWPCTMYYRRDRCEKGSNTCLQRIEPEMVFKALQKLMERCSET